MGQQDHLKRQTVEIQLLMPALIRAMPPSTREGGALSLIKG